MNDDRDSKEEAAKIEYSSPPCYASEFPGYFGEDDAVHPSGLVASLNTLLEAQRASAMVLDTCLQSLREHSEPWTRIKQIQQNYSANASALSNAILTLRGTPSRARGTLYDEAMAFEERAEKLQALKRSRQCVARQIDELLPCAPTVGLREMLDAMRLWHQTDIDVAEYSTAPRKGF